MKYTYSAILGVCMATSGFANPPLPLEGKYDCRGIEIGSKIPFHCEMLIKKTGETYASSAICDDGNTLYGNGIYIEEIHAIASGFTNPKKIEETGVTITYVKKDGSMSIDWTYLNSTHLGHTYCIKKHPL